MVSVSHLMCRSSAFSPAAGRALTDLAGQELAELDQVGTIALDGVVAEVFLELQVVEKLLDEGCEDFFQDHCAPLCAAATDNSLVGFIKPVVRARTQTRNICHPAGVSRWPARETVPVSL